MCDYIEYFDYDIAAFLKRDQGREYLKRSNMRESGIWGTETQIMATAKMFHRDVYTWIDNKWFHYSNLKEPSKDAIYLDNRYGRHFNVVLEP